MRSRVLSALLCAAGTGAVVGVLEALAAWSKGPILSAVVINAGLVSLMGMIGGAALLPLLWMSLGAEPRGRISAVFGRFRSPSGLTTQFVANAVVVPAALWLLLAVGYHLTHFAVTRFHHEGLIALFAAAGMVVLFSLIGWGARRGVRALTPYLQQRWGDAPPKRLAMASPFIVPALFVIVLLVSSKDGSGAVGFVGLLKREELSLAFLAWAVAPMVAATGCYIWITRKRVALVTVISGLTAGIGMGALLIAVFGQTVFNDGSAAVQEQLGLGGRLLSAARSWSDSDGDGVAGLFGGGDCDDADPNRYPSAIDVPGNGIDEDCSGKDNTAKKSADAEASPKLPAASASAAGSASPGRDNLSLVIITVDALRWDIGFMGYPRPITPNIDKLSKRSVIFEKSYALSSYTGRSLAPMFMGRYPSEAHCNYSHFTRYNNKNDMLAETLQAAGFATVGIGSHFYFEKPSGLKQGFDKFYVEIPPGPSHIDQKTTSDWVAGRAVKVLNDPEFTKGRFFLWAHFMDPHRDYLSHIGFDTFGTKPRDLYDGEVAFADHYVGKIIDTIAAKGLDSRTIVMVTADHGEAFNEHDVRYHGRRLWEEIVRVPWVVSIPGQAPKRIPYRVSHHALPATLYDLLNVKPPEQDRGHSLVPFITGRETADRRIFIDQPPGEYMEELYAIIDGGYKLIHTVVGNRFQLFDLTTDPLEKTNLASAQLEKLEAMKQIYRDFREGLEVNAPRR